LNELNLTTQSTHDSLNFGDNISTLIWRRRSLSVFDQCNIVETR